mgnify:CR=1 FL=1
MASQTSIEWTATYNDDGTVTPGFNWNFLRGCSRVSEGCRHCYAEGVAARFSGPGQPYEGLAKFVDHKPRWTGEILFIEDVLTQPLRWKKPRKIFVNSMSDLFHEKVQDEWLDRAFAVMALTPQHTYQVLTKRPDRMLEWFKSRGEWPLMSMLFDGLPYTLGEKAFLRSSYANIGDIPWPLPNVWLGVSVEDQKTADERIPILLETPAAVRWLSMEPLLGPVNLTRIHFRNDQGNMEEWDALDAHPMPNSVEPGSPIIGADDPVIDWVVVGGESGPNARPTHPDWIRLIRDQCQTAGVPFFFKQWGEWSPVQYVSDTGKALLKVSCDGKKETLLDGVNLKRLGKKASGRLLDGREWNEYPEVRNV